MPLIAASKLPKARNFSYHIEQQIKQPRLKLIGHVEIRLRSRGSGAPPRHMSELFKNPAVFILRPPALQCKSRALLSGLLLDYFQNFQQYVHWNADGRDGASSSAIRNQ